MVLLDILFRGLKLNCSFNKLPEQWMCFIRLGFEFRMKLAGNKLTSRKPGREKIYPNEVLISETESGLKKESIILCYQVRTLDKKRLSKQIGKIDDLLIQEKIIEALYFQLGMSKLCK